MMPPPPASVRLPQIDSVGAVAAGAVGYPLIPFPSEPWRLAYPSRELSQPVAAEYARCLNETEAGRPAAVPAGVAGEPRLDLMWQVRDFLAQSTAQPRGTGGRALRDWRSQALWRCYQQAVTGVVPPAADEEFPDVRFRMEPRYPLGLPARSEPGAPPELVDAVAAFRRAGWFERPRLEPPRLARAARAGWRTFQREDIPPARDAMAWRLLLLDTHPTWSEDADAGIEPGDGIYGLTLFALERIARKG